MQITQVLKFVVIVQLRQVQIMPTCTFHVDQASAFLVGRVRQTRELSYRLCKAVLGPTCSQSAMQPQTCTFRVDGQVVILHARSVKQTKPPCH